MRHHDIEALVMADERSPLYVQMPPDQYDELEREQSRQHGRYIGEGELQPVVVHGKAR
jgi:hypothetical protein